MEPKQGCVSVITPRLRMVDQTAVDPEVKLTAAKTGSVQVLANADRDIERFLTVETSHHYENDRRTCFRDIFLNNSRKGYLSIV